MHDNEEHSVKCHEIFRIVYDGRCTLHHYIKFTRDILTNKSDEKYPKRLGVLCSLKKNH